VGGLESQQPSQNAVSDDGIPAGTLAYIWFAMAMGGLALLTPCVFPMIPITVSFFTKREVSRKRALAEAGLYSGGIVLTFTVLGFILTLLFGAGGINRVATSPVINVLIASIFIVFALSLFGVFEIRVPSRWLTALDRKSGDVGGPIGILLMALTFSLTSFTCTVPFVGTVMVAATKGDWLWALLGITAFAVVFSAPFFFLALFPSFLKALPKSGSWMDSVKITMGFLELAAAMKFISNVDLVFQWEIITRPVFIAVWLALALVTSIYLLGRFRFSHEAPVESLSAGRVLFATFFLVISFYLLRGLFGFPLGELDAFLPPRDYGGVEMLGSLPGDPARTAEHAWLTDYSEALSVARVRNKRIFVDFTGYTCTNCRWMEANIFVRDRVRKLFDEFVLVRLYTDGGQPEHEENMRFEKERFGTIALPYYAVMTFDDDVVEEFAGLTRDESEFIDFLERGLGNEPRLPAN
jgi:thiol:disulfide interchange protein DsbD